MKATNISRTIQTKRKKIEVQITCKCQCVYRTLETTNHGLTPSITPVALKPKYEAGVFVFSIGPTFKSIL